MKTQYCFWKIFFAWPNRKMAWIGFFMSVLVDVVPRYSININALSYQILEFKVDLSTCHWHSNVPGICQRSRVPRPNSMFFAYKKEKVKSFTKIPPEITKTEIKEIKIKFSFILLLNQTYHFMYNCTSM